jgi:ribonuclease-3
LRQPVTHLTRRLGYEFRGRELLEQALTHRSAKAAHNERLEFLGDAVLGLVVAEALYRRFPDATEGQLSRFRASLVRKESLAGAASALDLGSYLELGAGELRTGGHARSSILADALEALFGAVYLDAGLGEAQRLILELLRSRIDVMDVDSCRKDPKTRLQEFLQGRQLGLPRYEIVQVEGAAHEQRFSCRCSVDDLGIEATGEGASRRRAEQAAAAQVLKRVEDDR